MADSRFLQVLFQNETLFKVVEPLRAKVPVQTDAVQPEVKVAQAVQTSDKPKPAAENVPAIRLKHKILIIVDEKKQEELLHSEAIFLNNILKAIGHSLEEVDILNVHFLPKHNLTSLLASKQIHHLITFGVPMVKLQLDLLLAPYTPQTIDGIRFLLADELVVIEADRNLKKKLWQALQNMFQIS